MYTLYTIRTIIYNRAQWGCDKQLLGKYRKNHEANDFTTLFAKTNFPSLEILVHRHHRIKLSSAINSSAALLGLCGSKIASRLFSQPNFAQIYQNSRHSSRHSKIQRAPRDLDSGILQAPTKFKEFHKLRKKAACQIKDLNMQSASS